MKRTIVLNTTQRSAKSVYTTYSLDMRLALAYDFDTVFVSFTPYFIFDSFWKYFPAFSEFDGGALNLDVKTFNTYYVQTDLGFSISGEYMIPHGCVKPEISLGWLYFQSVGNERIISTFANETRPFTTRTYDQSYYGGVLRLRLSANVAESVTFGAYVKAQFAPKFQSYAGGINMTKNF